MKPKRKKIGRGRGRTYDYQNGGYNLPNDCGGDVLASDGIVHRLCQDNYTLSKNYQSQETTALDEASPLEADSLPSARTNKNGQGFEENDEIPADISFVRTARLEREKNAEDDELADCKRGHVH